MGHFRQDNAESTSDTMSATSQRREASSFPWPGTSCVSSPCANRAGTLHEFHAPEAAQRISAQLLKGPAVQSTSAAKKLWCEQPRGQPSVPLGCILLEPQSVSPAHQHDQGKVPPVSPMQSAEKENTPSPNRTYLCHQVSTAPAEVQASRTPTADVGSRETLHREAPLQQPLQQASALQADMLMQDASQLMRLPPAQGILSAPLAPGTIAHHSMQVPTSSKQYQHPRPASAQACNREATVAKQAIKAWSRHAAPEECDPLLTRFAWNLDQKGQPDSITHLQSSGIFPDQGPLGVGQEALQQLSFSSSASDASMARRAQRIEDEAMLYLSHSSSNDSARVGKQEGGFPVYLSRGSNDSAAHPVHISLEKGTPTSSAPCAADSPIPGELLQAQMTFEGFPQAEGHAQPEILIRSSCISSMPWDLSRRDQPAAPVPNLPRHLATPLLMQRAGDPAFYNEPELGRTTPLAERPNSLFTHPGMNTALLCWRSSEDVDKGTPSRAKLPPLPAHLKKVLTPPSAKRGADAAQQALPTGCAVTGPEPATQSHTVQSEARQPATALQAAILQQAARFKPAYGSPSLGAPVQAAPNQAQSMGAHDATMSAIRKGQFQLKAVKEPAQQIAPTPDARNALMSAIRNQQFSLKAVNPVGLHTAGTEDKGVATDQIPRDEKLGSPLGGLHALIRQRTAALGTCEDSSSNGTGWEV